MKALVDKVAIITGASSGIGHAAALLFAREGAKIVVNARRKEKLDALVTEIRAAGSEAIAVAGDAASEDVAKALVESAVSHFGGLDVAFNNVGAIGAMSPVPQLDLEDWHDTININLTSAFLGAKYQVPALLERGGGSLIFTSTFVGHTVGMPGLAAYAAGKAGLVGLVQVLATEWGTRNIRANAILPGGTDTPANFANAPDASAETRSFVEGLHALKRMATPREIAQAALFLASDASSFVTGTAMRVDGGVSINRT